MKKRFFTFLLALVMVFAALPLQVFSAAEDIVTITLVDGGGDIIPDASDATVTVTRSYRSGWYSRTQNMTVAYSDGIFTYDRSEANGGTTQYYTVSVSLEGYSTQTVRVDANADDAIITLSQTGVVWEDFDLYYIATGKFPDNLSGAGDEANYGPSGNNTPFATISVNITKLQNMPGVAYTTGGSNKYEFIPDDFYDAGMNDDERLECAKTFWESVLECTSASSKKILDDTGLANTFVGYCLKDQGSGSSVDCHGDGILLVNPPVYVIELQDRGKYVGGIADGIDENGKLLVELNTEASISEEMETIYKSHYGNIVNGSWKRIDGRNFTFQYVADGYTYTMKVEQTNYDAQSKNIYAKVSYDAKVQGEYFYAVFNATEVSKTKNQLTVTYTDGFPYENVFADEVYAVKYGDSIVEFKGSTAREGYIFKGWVLQGGDGKIMSQQEILDKYPTVTSDMTFVAVYDVAPVKYYGTVEVILDGTYDTTTATATGTRVDIEKVTGYSDLYVKAVNSDTYIHLARTSEGVYSANLENGDYQIYYYKDNEYILASDQYLTISHANRTRYLFFNSVTYDTNGGSNGPDPATEYYPTGSAVLVSETVPTRDGYAFLGWKATDIDTLLQPGVTLDRSIGKAYTLVAQWQEVADLYVNITLLHGDNTAPSKSYIDFTVDYRTGDSGSFTEWIAKSIEWNEKLFFVGDWNASFVIEEKATYYKYKLDAPLLTNVPVDYEYTFTTTKPDYIVSSVNTTYENGKIVIDAVLEFKPELYNFTFDVELDENALAFLSKEGNAIYKPAAANVKILGWNGTQWVTIEQLKDTYIRVAIGDDGKGTGSYPVWGRYGEETVYYRIEIVSYELADGTIVAAEDVGNAHTNYDSVDNRYNAVIETKGCTDPVTDDASKLDGAYFDQNEQQVGSVKAVISIPLYNVTFIPNGGTLNNTTENTIVADQIIVPDLNSYIPERDGGYIFDGWYLVDENGNMTETVVTSGYPLYEDITLIAKWKEPLTISGLVTVEGTHTHVHANGEEDTHELDENERAKTAIVILQKNSSQRLHRDS